MSSLESSTVDQAAMQLIDRVNQSLEDIGYLRAGGTEPGYILDEPRPGIARLRWGYDRTGKIEFLREPDDWVNMCADYLLFDGFDVHPDGGATDEGGAILING